MPWVIHWPGHLPAGKRIDWPVSQLDVTPTILSVLGYDIRDAGFEGSNALTAPAAERRLYFSSWYEGSPLGFTEGSRKWIYWPRTDEVFEYDLVTDPEERFPTCVDGPERDAAIAALKKWQRDSYVAFDAKRFRKRFVFDHWMTFSSGRYGRAYYVP